MRSLDQEKVSDAYWNMLVAMRKEGFTDDYTAYVAFNISGSILNSYLSPEQFEETISRMKEKVAEVVNRDASGSHADEQKGH